MSISSINPYIFKAFLEWMSDNEQTPHLLLDTRVNGVDVPTQYVSNNLIMLSISKAATHEFKILESKITFKARFSGVEHQIEVPYKAMLELRAVESNNTIPLIYWMQDDQSDEQKPEEAQNTTDLDLNLEEDDLFSISKQNSGDDSNDDSNPGFSLVSDKKNN